MKQQDFFDCVQACWDRGADPVDDPSVQEWLLRHPDALEPFAQWRGAVSAISELTPLRRRSGWLAGVAASLLAASLVVGALRWASATGGPVGTGSGAVLFSTFEHDVPRMRRSVRWTEHHVLFDTPDTFFSITEHRSSPR